MENVKVRSNFLSKDNAERQKNFNKLAKEMAMARLRSGEYMKNNMRSIHKEK